MARARSCGRARFPKQLLVLAGNESLFQQAVKRLAGLAAEAVGCNVRIIFEVNNPDGNSRKLLNVSRAASLGWKGEVSLREGNALAYDNFQKQTT